MSPGHYVLPRAGTVIIIQSISNLETKGDIVDLCGQEHCLLLAQKYQSKVRGPPPTALQLSRWISAIGASLHDKDFKFLKAVRAELGDFVGYVWGVFFVNHAEGLCSGMDLDELFIVPPASWKEDELSYIWNVHLHDSLIPRAGSTSRLCELMDRKCVA